MPRHAAGHRVPRMEESDEYNLVAVGRIRLRSLAVNVSPRADMEHRTRSSDTTDLFPSPSTQADQGCQGADEMKLCGFLALLNVFCLGSKHRVPEQGERMERHSRKVILTVICPILT